MLADTAAHPHPLKAAGVTLLPQKSKHLPPLHPKTQQKAQPAKPLLLSLSTWSGR